MDKLSYLCTAIPPVDAALRYHDITWGLWRSGAELSFTTQPHHSSSNQHSFFCHSTKQAQPCRACVRFDDEAMQAAIRAVYGRLDLSQSRAAMLAPQPPSSSHTLLTINSLSILSPQ